MPLHPVPRTGSGGRLAALLGLSRMDYMRMFDRVNLLAQCPERWDRVAAAASALNLAASILRGRRLVLVGQRVRDAFGLGRPMMDWAAGPHGDWAWIPHPSGLNTWYNHEENRATVREFLLRYGVRGEVALLSDPPPL